MEKYNEGLSTEFTLPYSERLLKQAKSIEIKIIDWYEKNHYAGADSYSVRITNKGKWEVSYSNDYPMQHGGGRSLILSEEDFYNAIKQ